MADGGCSHGASAFRGSQVQIGGTQPLMSNSFPGRRTAAVERRRQQVPDEADGFP